MTSFLFLVPPTVQPVFNRVIGLLNESVTISFTITIIMISQKSKYITYNGKSSHWVLRHLIPLTQNFFLKTVFL